MAIDPKKLSAYGARPDAPIPGSRIKAALADDVKPLPSQTPKKEPEEDEDEYEEDDEEAPETERSEDDEEGSSDDDIDFDSIKPLIIENSGEVEACLDEMSLSAVTDPEGSLSDDDLQIIQEGFDGLPEDLHEVLVAELTKGVSLEECQDFADSIADEGEIEDPDRLAAWLFHVAKLLAQV